MKKAFLIFPLVVLALSAQARTNVSVGFYSEPAYYAPSRVTYVEAPVSSVIYEDNTPAWLSAPVQIVWVDGTPHRMHYWAGRWYDETYDMPRRTVIVERSPAVIHREVIYDRGYYGRPYHRDYHGPRHHW